VVHGAAQDVCERDFVKAVALWGVPPRRVISRQVLPSLVTPLMVETGLRLSFSIIVIAGINFLGFGVTPPDPNWGVMINENRLGLGLNAWAVMAPALLLAVLSVGTNTFTDAVARANLGEARAEEAVLSASLGTTVES
jgi:peptide/nickel transport system permease protein